MMSNHPTPVNLIQYDFTWILSCTITNSTAMIMLDSLTWITGIIIMPPKHTCLYCPLILYAASYAADSKIQSCPATTRLVITLIGCNAVGRASRFFRPLGYFYLVYIFDCKLLYLLCTLPRCTFTTMSIVYLFVSVLLLYVGK